MPAWKLARAIRDGELSSEEVVRQHIERILEVNSHLHAVVHFHEEDRERALRQAREADAARLRGDPVGPLHGLPITLKDSLDTAGLVTTAGTTGRADYIPQEDASVVKKLRNAGAIIVGKTNTPELTLDYKTDNLIYGRTANPYDLDRTPGGSSGGSASIVAAGGSPLDVGSDTAGSIRLPCHFCGIAGLKPSRGRVSRIGHILPPGGLVGEWTQIGPMARCVRDLALALPLISGPDNLDSTLAPVPFGAWEAVRFDSIRGRFFTRFGSHRAESEIAQAVQDAAEALADAGAELEQGASGPLMDLMGVADLLHYGDGGQYYAQLLKTAGTEEISPNLRAILESARTKMISGAAYSSLLQRLDRLKRDMLASTEGLDVLLCPVCSSTAPEHRTRKRLDYAFLPAFNVLGWPVATVRVATGSNGMPIGIQIVGKPWQEHLVLAVAGLFEQQFGGWRHDFDARLTAVQGAGEPTRLPWARGTVFGS